MALLFSQVTVTAGNDAASFLVGGIPREYDDLEDWDEFDDFLKYIDEETEVLVHADAYLYGEGETSEALTRKSRRMVYVRDRRNYFVSIYSFYGTTKDTGQTNRYCGTAPQPGGNPQALRFRKRMDGRRTEGQHSRKPVVSPI